MTFLEQATTKRAAYLAAGYKCAEIEETESYAKFIARDQYGVERVILFGDASVMTPLQKKARAKVPTVVEPPVVQPTPVKKPRKKKGE